MIHLISTRQNHLSQYNRLPIEQVQLKEVSGLDLETTGLSYHKNKILLLLLGDDQDQYIVDWGCYTLDQIKALLSPVKLFIGHNLSFDLRFLLYNGVNFSLGSIYDTMETELTLTKGTGLSVSLAETAKRRLNVTSFDKGVTKEFTLMDYRDPYFLPRHIDYGAEDIKHLGQIREEQLHYVSAFGQTELCQTNNNMVIVSAQMTITGIKLNKEKWLKIYTDNLAKLDQLKIDMDQELARLGLVQRKERRIGRAVQLDILGGSVDATNKNSENINYGSPAQIKDIFKFFKQPLPKKQDDTDTTGSDEIEEYIKDRPKSKLIPFLKLLLEYRIVSKQISTYGKSFIEENLGDDGRIHSEYKINRTETGRLSSNNPNMQNIPAIQSFRSCFEASEGFKLWTADYSSAELRILASLSGDDNMLKWYREGEDLHSLLATPVYNYLNGTDIKITKKTHPEFRNQQKTVNFGIAYGASGYKISKVMNISKGQGEKVLDIMRSMIPSAFELLERLSYEGQYLGKVKFEKKWNQYRYFYDIATGQKVSQKRLAAVGREAMNAPFQGVNAQMTKLAMVTIYRYIVKKNLKSRIVATVHDEIVMEIANDEVSYIPIFKNFMEEAANYFLDGVSMEVEDHLGEVWSK